MMMMHITESKFPMTCHVVMVARDDTEVASSCLPLESPT